MQSIMFYILGFGAVLSALLMVTSRKPVAAAMSLVLTMFFLAGIYVLLEAHLIAALQIIVYAGAIMVLFLFVIMLLNMQEKEGWLAVRKIVVQFSSIGIVGILFVIVAGSITIDHTLIKARSADFGTTRAVGKILFTNYILPFEIASILLLAAIVGAVILAKRRIDDSE